jgi:tRNA (adenine57-N1/adenine58-N1)-methyltransferase
MTFQAGELVAFIDQEGRAYLQRLVPGGRFHSHRGYVVHDTVIGAAPGTVVTSSRGAKFYVFYPTLTDFTMNMPRISGIIYPKDTGIILLWADIFPGAKVLIGGVGSGALLLAVVRQIGAGGAIVAYDVRQDMLDHAAQNLREFLGATPQLTLKHGDIYQPIEEEGFDRVLLDVPEPWRVIETLQKSLAPGGIVSAYVPSITQADAFVNALKGTGNYALVETIEVLVRDWHIAGRSVRPHHRMVGHTGFLTFARKLSAPQTLSVCLQEPPGTESL